MEQATCPQSQPTAGLGFSGLAEERLEGAREA